MLISVESRDKMEYRNQMWISGGESRGNAELDRGYRRGFAAKELGVGFLEIEIFLWYILIV